MSGRRLPTLHPEWTDDEGEYIYRWELIGKKVAAFLGGKLIDFDPSFKIEVPSHNHLANTEVETISLRTALKIMETLEAK